MDILGSLGALSTAQAQQLMELQTTQNTVQQLIPKSSPASTPAVTVDLSPAAQAALNARSTAAVASDTGGQDVDAGTTGYDDGGYAAQQSDTSVDPSY